MTDPETDSESEESAASSTGHCEEPDDDDSNPKMPAANKMPAPKAAPDVVDLTGADTAAAADQSALFRLRRSLPRRKASLLPSHQVRVTYCFTTSQSRVLGDVVLGQFCMPSLILYPVRRRIVLGTVRVW
jgi:hypothetical protein